jgi:hypothetical protein
MALILIVFAGGSSFRKAEAPTAMMNINIDSMVAVFMAPVFTETNVFVLFLGSCFIT